MHFHYAGFALPILTGLAGRALPGLLARSAAALVITGVPLVALGFAFWPLLEWLAAWLLTVGCILAGVNQFHVAVRSTVWPRQALLAVSAVSLMAGMALAAVYALGEYRGTAWLDIPAMLPFHGVANALGFALLGLCAWALLPQR
ncbi:MAG: YndJ family transporter [Pirellulales bacterium]